MSTIPNPLYAGFTPTNPTGTSVSVPGSTSSSGANPLLPSAGTSSSAPGSTNPLTAGFTSSSVPTFSANGPGPVSLTGAPTLPATNAGQAAVSPIGGMSTMSPTDISRMYNDLKKTYGDGIAHSLLNFLTSGAGFNQDAINNLFAAMQPQIERGTESLANQFSTTGNRFGSGAQIGMADYLSQVNLNEGQLETQMYEQAINEYISTLTGVASQNAQRKAATPSPLDDALAIAGTVIPGAAMAAQALKPTGIAPMSNQVPSGNAATDASNATSASSILYPGSTDAQQQQLLDLIGSAGAGL
jgi:hypothetical protein